MKEVPTAIIEPLTAPYEAELQADFDRVMPRGMPPLLLFRTVATSKRAWAKFKGGSLLDRGPLSLRDREIVIHRTCALCSCEYEWGAHVVAFAKAVKFTPEQIEATVNGRADASCWSAKEKHLIAAVDALHEDARLGLDQIENLSLHYDNDQLLEIIQLCGFYRTVSYLANSLDLECEPGTPRFPAGVSKSK